MVKRISNKKNTQTDEERTLIKFLQVQDGEVMNCFPFCKKEKEGSYVVIVYIYAGGSEEVFLISREMETPVNREAENEFLSIIYNDNIHLKAPRYLLSQLVMCIVSTGWDPYLQVDETCRVLTEIYYTSYKNPAEKLFKAGHIREVVFACISGEISGINLIETNEKTTVKEILGVRLGMLRSMSRNGISFLQNKIDREKADMLYGLFHNYIYGKSLTKSQLTYLFDLIEDRESFNQRTFEGLAEYSECEQRKLMVYLRYRTILLPYYRRIPPSVGVEELDEYLSIMQEMEYYIIHQSQLDYDLARKAEKYRGFGCLNEDQSYYVVVLDSVESFLKKSSEMDNCLYRYIPNVAYAREPLFIAVICDMETNKTLIYLEIRENKYVVQALGKRSRKIERNTKEFEYLCDYLEAKKLLYVQ